ETTGSSITDTTTASASTSSPKTSPPKPFSFYTDLIDEKVNDSNHTSEDNESMDAMDDDVMQVNDQSSDLDEESNHMNIDITVPDIKVDPKVASLGFTTDSPIPVILNNKIKPILCYIKKGNKKSVRWIDENGRNNIETVKFFELDE
ncbi:unnamed protein product, partial [Oppiella nova]